jgi:hypothetical protein
VRNRRFYHPNSGAGCFSYSGAQSRRGAHMKIQVIDRIVEIDGVVDTESKVVLWA